MPYELPSDPRTERRARYTRWLSFAFAALLVVLVTYLGYVGYEGSRQLTSGPGSITDCRTPATYGWEYEAVNYDPATDAALADEPDPEACTRRGAAAGDELTGPGGVAIAAWYVPSGNDAGPTAPTVVIAHGWGSNKSNMLPRAELLHPHYNLLIPDLRNHGQSGEAATTQGVLEAGDLRAAIDWLESVKGPDRVAVLGVSLGGATALREASGDDRVDALVVESTHATISNAIRARLEAAGYPLSVPGAWATLLGSLLRTGQDITLADPIASITRLDERPLMLVHGSLDHSIRPSDAQDMLEAAEEAGSPATLHVCPGAGHGGSPTACAEEYPDWVLGFLERYLASAG
jgi:pimeloyl-ACP methyl ester carboxylesterase